MAHMSVPCHEGPPATKGHFSSEPAVAGRGRYYCSTGRVNMVVNRIDKYLIKAGFTCIGIRAGYT